MPYLCGLQHFVYARTALAAEFCPARERASAHIAEFRSGLCGCCRRSALSGLTSNINRRRTPNSCCAGWNDGRLLNRRRESRGLRIASYIVDRRCITDRLRIIGDRRLRDSRSLLCRRCVCRSRICINRSRLILLILSGSRIYRSHRRRNKR